MKFISDPKLNSLLYRISISCSDISDKIKTASINGHLGYNNQINVHGEQVKKLDEIANQIIVTDCRHSPYCAAIISEEQDEAIVLNSSADYILAIDPLDGSSNIDIGISVGTIFGIYQHDGSESFLKAGNKLILAGYVLYGPSTLMVIAYDNNVCEYTLDATRGWVLTRDDIRCPKNGNIYSINEGNYSNWPGAIKDWKNYLTANGNHSLRYVGSLVADAHRTLINGGIFAYPADNKNTSGKLRLMYECNPMAYIFETAHGAQTNGINRVLDIVPTDIHQRAPLVIGSLNDVLKFQSIFTSRSG